MIFNHPLQMVKVAVEIVAEVQATHKVVQIRQRIHQEMEEMKKELQFHPLTLTLNHHMVIIAVLGPTML